MNSQSQHTEIKIEAQEDVTPLPLKRHKAVLTTPIAIIIAAIILGMSHILYAVIIGGKNTDDTAYFLGSSLGENSYATGNIKSDVLVVEYSDTECPFCARLYPTMSEIQRNYSDRVAFDYRHFPLTSIHPNAFGEAVAIECIGQELGAAKRREYIDRLFSYKINNNSMKLPNGAKEALAKEVGANTNTFASCLS
jgi:protein-disulfide isomerase